MRFKKCFFSTLLFLLDLTMSVCCCIAEVYYGPPQTNGFSCTHNWRPHVFFIGPSAEIKCEVPKINISPTRNETTYWKKNIFYLSLSNCMHVLMYSGFFFFAYKNRIRSAFRKKVYTILANTSYNDTTKITTLFDIEKILFPRCFSCIYVNLHQKRIFVQMWCLIKYGFLLHTYFVEKKKTMIIFSSVFA